MKKKIIILFTIIIIIFGIVLVINSNSITISITPNKNCTSDDLEKIGSIKNRDVYTYCAKDIDISPKLNKKMKTKDIINRTKKIYQIVEKTDCLWDGGTCIYDRGDYVIVDCQDYGNEERTTKIVITPKNNKYDVINSYHACVKSYR